MKPKRGIWVLALAAALALVLAGTRALAEEEKPPEEKIAIVNGVVISRTDFGIEVIRLQRQLMSEGGPISPSQFLQLKKQALENLIDRELLYQESQKLGSAVEEEAVDEKMKGLRERFSSEAEYKEALERMDLSEEGLRFQVERALVIQQFIHEEFIQKVRIQDDKVKAYYEGHTDFFKQPEQIRASHILIKVEPGADQSQKAEARKKIEEVQKRVQEGEDFAALAREFSEGPSGAGGGDIGYFKRGQGEVAEAFEEAAVVLKPGEVSGIVETTFGFHLIKITDRKPESIAPYDEVKGNIERFLKQQKVNEEVNLYVEELKEKAVVERFLE